MSEKFARWLLAGLVGSLFFVATLYVATEARADHYHTYNNITHGLVHGDSDTDGAFFGRTYGYYAGGVNYCGVGDRSRGWYHTTYTYNADLCSVWTLHVYGSPDECAGLSYNRVARYGGGSDFVGEHAHGAHSPPQSSCRRQYT